MEDCVIWSERGCATSSRSVTRVSDDSGKVKLRADVLVNPLFAFSFLEAFLATLRDYLGETTETSIKDNFDIVYMVR